MQRQSEVFVFCEAAAAAAVVVVAVVAVVVVVLFVVLHVVVAAVPVALRAGVRFVVPTPYQNILAEVMQIQFP